MSIPTELDVQEAADALIRTLSQSSGWKNTRIAIVGGAALQYYLTQPSSPPMRITNNIDVVIRHNTQDSPIDHDLIQAVLRCDSDRFFIYKTDDGGLQSRTGVFIRFCEERELSYRPSGFLSIIEAWRRGITPYVPVEDLLVHKITSAPLRTIQRDCIADADDALFLVKPVPGAQPPKIRLSAHQRVVLDQAIGRFAEYSSLPEEFWRDILQI
ncbi:hypothetical protein BJX68DRAFT_267038 [Aspergillus pseudodeflectus]|uniref:Nucleotidyl transferase AbiEii/AbiGii toxin family protein n=1 Tax=Aspergillus pseudodeflectus TaxID=176178 RepID=A0ABR4KCG9_9EURO